MIRGSNEDTIKDLPVTEVTEEETKKDQMHAPKCSLDAVFIPSKISPAWTPHIKIYKKIGAAGNLTTSPDPEYTKEIRLRKDKFKKMNNARKRRARRQEQKEKNLITNHLHSVKSTCPPPAPRQTSSTATDPCPASCVTIETLRLIQEKIRQLEMEEEKNVEEEYNVGFQLGSLNRRLWRRTSGRRGGARGLRSRRRRSGSISEVLHYSYHDDDNCKTFVCGVVLVVVWAQSLLGCHIHPAFGSDLLLSSLSPLPS